MRSSIARSPGYAPWLFERNRVAIGGVRLDVGDDAELLGLFLEHAQEQSAIIAGAAHDRFQRLEPLARLDRIGVDRRKTRRTKEVLRNDWVDVHVSGLKRATEDGRTTRARFYSALWRPSPCVATSRFKDEGISTMSKRGHSSAHSRNNAQRAWETKLTKLEMADVLQRLSDVARHRVRRAVRWRDVGHRLDRRRRFRLPPSNALPPDARSRSAIASIGMPWRLGSRTR